MSFQQGLSGLNTSSKALAVIGNNVANSSTVGFKASNANFADVYASSLAGGTALQVGIGSSMAAVSQQFTQGNITTTNSPLDIAINGNGFFRMSRNGAISYTRNGQFRLDNQGYITNDQNLRLTGFRAANDGTINRQTPSELQIEAAQLKLSPQATGSTVGGQYAGVQLSANLDSRAPLRTWTAPTAAVPNIDPATYNYTTALSIYDSLGNPHTMTFYFVKSTTPGAWDVYASVDGTLSGGNTPNLTTPVTLTFDSNGKLVDVGGDTAAPFETAISVDLDAVAADLQTVDPSYPPNGATNPLAFNLKFDGTTQFGSAFSTGRLIQDGYSAGELAGLAVNRDGTIQGRYSNGQTRNIGQLVLATFQNPNGLANTGGNQWVQTAESGQPTVDTPGSGQLGAVQSNAVEESNVDLTAELVKMITQQRNYQANAQTIKTQDQVMQTLVNLR